MKKIRKDSVSLITPPASPKHKVPSYLRGRDLQRPCLLGEEEKEEEEEEGSREVSIIGKEKEKEE